MIKTAGSTDLKNKNVKETLGHSQVGKGVKNSVVNAQMQSRKEIGTAPPDFEKGKIQENKNWRKQNF